MSGIADIVELGLGQSLTLKSLSTATTTNHPSQIFLKDSRHSRWPRFDIKVSPEISNLPPYAPSLTNPPRTLYPIPRKGETPNLG